MYFPVLSNNVSTRIKSSCIKGAAASFFFNAGSKGALYASAITLFTPTLLEWTGTAAQKGLGQIKATLGPRCPQIVQRKAQEISAKIVSKAQRAELITNSLVMEVNLANDLGNLFHLLNLSEPQFYISRVQKEFVRIDLNKIDELDCLPRTKRLLKVAKKILAIKKTLGFTNPFSIAHFGALCYVLDKLTICRQTHLFKIVKTAYFTLTLLGAGLRLANLGTYKNFWPMVEQNKPENCGALAVLPNDVLRLIIHAAGTKNRCKFALLNHAWRALCFTKSLRLEMIQRQFGTIMADAIGPQLLDAPWIDLKVTKFTPAPACTEEEWVKFFNPYLFVPGSVNHSFAEEKLGQGMALNRPIQLSKVLSRDASSKVTIYGPNPLPRPSDAPNPILPSFETSKTASCSFVFAVNPEDLQGHMLGKFVVGNLWGIAFNYTFTYFENGKRQKGIGTGIVHQLRGDKPDDYIWFENQRSPQYSEDNPSDYDNTYPLLKDVQGTSIRYFVFTYPSVPNAQNLWRPQVEWIKKLASGETCGYLTYGIERTRDQDPKMQLTPGLKNSILNSIFRKLFGK